MLAWEPYLLWCILLSQAAARGRLRMGRGKRREASCQARSGPYEAEQAAVDCGASIKRIGTDRAGNPEYVFVGKTDDGRILFMVGIRKRGRIWRIGSARDAKFQEKRAYRRRNR